MRLIEANRQDQRVSRYQTWDQLRRYCTLSADPVGARARRVRRCHAERIALSDSICTALQLAEHCQDVAEDLRSGRIYMPAEDLVRFDCDAADLAAGHAGPQVRELLAFEVARARALLGEGAPLIDLLQGRARLAVAAFIAGGRAALDAIERGYDVPGAASGSARRLGLWRRCSRRAAAVGDDGARRHRHGGLTPTATARR